VSDASSCKEHLPEEDHNRWPKHVAGYTVYNTINLHICILRVVLILIMNHQCIVMII
jgi:hypothetical protein